MTWFKTDDKLWGNAKWRSATKGARALWTTAGSWCADQENDGHVPRHMLTVLDGTPREAQNLVDVGLWEVTNHGWIFHDWHDYQPTRTDLKNARDREREKKRRWRERAGRGTDGQYVSTRDSTGDTPGDTTGDNPGESRGASTRIPSRPVPTRPSSLTLRGHVASLLGWQEEEKRLDHVDTLLATHDVRSPRAWLTQCAESGDLEHLLTQAAHPRTDDTWSHLPKITDADLHPPGGDPA